MYAEKVDYSSNKLLNKNTEVVPSDTKKEVTHFEQAVRVKIITSLLKSSLALEMYEISYEVTRTFKNELDIKSCLTVFDLLFEALKSNPSKYEIKIAIFEGL